MNVLSQLVCCVPYSLWSPSVSCWCSLCADARDSIAKVAYGRVFGWIVCKVNELLAENVDPEVELGEIGEFCFLGPVLSSDACLSATTKSRHNMRFRRGCVQGSIFKDMIMLEVAVSSVKSVGPLPALCSFLVWSNHKAVVLQHSGFAGVEVGLLLTSSPRGIIAEVALVTWLRFPCATEAGWCKI